ncbi:MAG: hypothetical protein H0X38_03320 [Planctomycetes bacterium]|nr:hypothetical protein [Planctomycetota bacterium]
MRRELQAEHLPITWEELDLHTSPPSTLATWKRIGELSKALKTFDNQYPDLIGTTAGLTPFSPVPDAARIQHAMLDQDKLDELRACVDALGDQALEFRTRVEFATTLGEISIVRNVTNLLRDDVLLADPSRLGETCQRMLRFVSLQGRGTVISHLVRIAVTGVAFNAVAGRLAELKREAQRIDGLVRTLAESCVDGLPAMQTRQMLFLLTSLAKPLPPSLSFTVTEIGWLDRLLFPFVVRAGRAPLLRHAADLISAYAPQAESSRTLASVRHLESLAMALRESHDPSHHLMVTFDPFDDSIPRMAYECRLHGRLLLSALHDEPWPEDWSDPLHPTLRALVRGGRTVGAYCLGKDEMDHLGNKPNRYFPLLERFTPLKPPPP